MSRRQGLKLPWEKDPNDREANYRRPVAQHEKVRLTVKGASAAAAFLFIMSMTRDRRDVGAEFLIGLGAPLLIAGTMDLVWTLQERLEHIFIESRTLQLAAHTGMALVGAGMLTAGLVAKGT